MVAPVQLMPTVLLNTVRSKATRGSLSATLVPVVNVPVNAWKLAPLTSFTPPVTWKVKVTLAGRISRGVSVIESPPPVVLTAAATLAPVSLRVR